MNGLNNTVNMTEERVHELEDRRVEITQSEQPKESRLKETNKQTKLQGPVGV